ncbi:phage recombination protein Bet [Halarsenatibacter silvermanii]|uniref:Phage recombination protein Bet n=1 Tax=Halarsenatibacter silvermanii TaxID=321763 RepID=A0A1G9RV09_9FIRM|nr:phage recombination protein Bet [Halarsenatibacter silvermanii]SDM26994.1 phage recombination protein Bet [Halarsenatibacter silvermanii]
MSEVVKTQENSGEKMSFTQEEIETIKNTVAAKANQDELKMFLTVAQKYGLDPFNKEIFFWKINGKPQIMTSRDGYLKIADRHPQYDGLVSDVVREQDQFKRRTDGIDHEYGTERGDIIGAYALVYRKDRSYPFYAFAPFAEYKAGSRVWNNYPSAMILKVAESMALKRAFTVSGLVSREEMEVTRLENEERMASRQNDSEDEIDITPKAQDKSREKIADKDQEKKLTEREKEIKKLVEGSGELREEVLNYLSYIKEKNDLEKVSLAHLDEEEFAELKGILENIKSMIAMSAS